ncbi:MAG TPA: hypothetical protein VM737_09920 [Gemmatimonadota bacterium]|nr:hypothetical protein [Gemmatimonadota bacterium]
MIPDDVGQPGAWAQDSFQSLEMPRHASKVEFCHSRIESLESGGLPKLDTARLDPLGDPLDFWMAVDPRIVIVSLVYSPGIGPHETLLECAEILRLMNEAKQNRLETSCTSIVLLVGVRRRSDHGVDRIRLENTRDHPGIRKTSMSGSRNEFSQLAQIIGDASYFRHPRRNNRTVFLLSTDPDLGTEMKITDMVDHGLRERQAQVIEGLPVRQAFEVLH